MRIRHKCNYVPCLINYKKNAYDLASYCTECGKLEMCIDNTERIATEIKDGKICRRLKTSAELLNEFCGKYPIIKIGAN